MIPTWLKALWALLLLASVAQAQFQFFEHMFGGGSQQERAQPDSQNVPSDSSRYQRQWESGKLFASLSHANANHIITGSTVANVYNSYSDLR